MRAAILALALFGVYSISGWANQQSGESILEHMAEAAAPRNIRVLLEEGSLQALLEIKGSYIILNPHDGSKIASSTLGKRFMIHASESGLKWGEEFPGIFQIYLQPKSEDTPFFVNGIQYAGAIAVFAIGDRLHIVNDLSIEAYVKGLLSVQTSSALEPEVLSALAILSRTNAYYAVSRSSDSFWHVSSAETSFQGSALVAPNSAIERAVDSTRHLILVHSKEGKPFPFATTWTEHSAGKTVPYQVMFRKDGLTPAVSVDAPHAALDRKDAKWNFSLPKKTLAHLLDLAQIKSIDLFIDKSSNKVYGLRVHDGAATHDFDFFDVQSRLGDTRLQSSDFTITLKDDQVLFNGFGKGHGVGLCLYSASAMAQNGDNAAKILAKFFPETYIQNLNTPPLRKERF